jgi:hypothetical protein
LRKEEAPIDTAKKVKQTNKNDEARGSIRMSISSDLRFHPQGIDHSNKVWQKLEATFDKRNEI